MRKIITILTMLLIFNSIAWGSNKIESSDDVIILDQFRMKITSFDNPPAIDEQAEAWDLWNGLSFTDEQAEKGNMITLKTAFNISSSLKGIPLGIYIGPTPYPCNIYVNGYLAFKSGQYGAEWIAGGFLSHSFILAEKALLYGDRKNILTVEIVPNKFTEAFSKLKLSSQRRASADTFKRNFSSVYLIRATSFISLLLAGYYLMLYFSSSRADRRFLYFALLCLAFVMSYLEIIFASDCFPDLVIKKLSKIGFTLLLIALTSFVIEFTLLKKIKTLIRIITAGPGIVFIIILIINNTHSSVDNTLGYMLNYYFPIVILINLIIMIYSSIKNKNLNNIVLLLAIIGAISGSLIDITVILSGTIPYTYLTPYGFLLIIIALFVILTFEQLHISRKNKDQAVILAEKNRIQKEMIEGITGLSEYLEKSGNRLNDKISESAIIIAKNSVANEEMNNSIRKQVDSIEQTLPEIEKNLGESASRILTALTNQGAYADEVGGTLSKLISEMESSQTNLNKTRDRAEKLNKIASENRNVIDQSTKALLEISSYSKVIQEVLADITDITTRTDLLAMNASIEAAHAGLAGKGFAVVANEVRNLSSQSRKQISESNKKVEGMEGAIEHSRKLSTQVSDGLHSIIDEAISSSLIMKKTREDLELQQTDTNELLHSVQILIDDTITIKGLSEENRNVNTEVQTSLKSYRKTLIGFSELIDKQESQIQELKSNIHQIEELFHENLNNIDNLKTLL